ncbi:39S ribosomal protein L9, mitochondrial [Cimex lectularius]|uniref:Large ribosomal subunit protein bL9m n=1 Tax=Cimex lectularius TaxID=79782 RepID=A0A8I6SEA8_CIMLE|nr:39S ribosomal protein L9, mitochondrial [Cimex lectularius]
MNSLINKTIGLSLVPCTGGLTGTFSKRFTYILKRRYPVTRLPKNYKEAKFKGKNYIYDLIEDTSSKKQRDVQVILKTFVEGIGRTGSLVTLQRNYAYNHLLLPGLAEYASPEAIAKAATASKEESDASSPFAPMTQKYLNRLILNVIMNKDVEWTLEPWHLRVAFRKAGCILPQNSIILPEKPIKGPDLSLENKMFLVKVKINNKEIATVRCLLHHWSTNPADKLPYIVNPWFNEPEPMFEEDRETINNLPVITPKDRTARQN